MRLTEEQKRELRAIASRGPWAIAGWAPSVLALLDEVEELRTSADRFVGMSDLEIEVHLSLKRERNRPEPHFEITEFYNDPGDGGLSYSVGGVRHGRGG